VTPRIYSTIGKKYSSKKGWLWFATALATIAVFISVTLAPKISSVMPPQVLFGVGSLLSIITWGILMAIYWYGPDGKMAPETIMNVSGIKMRARQFASWYGAIFLSAWFVLGACSMLWYLWGQ